MQQKERSAIIWGATGQAKIAARILSDMAVAPACLCDRRVDVASPLAGVPIWHTEEEFLVWLEGFGRERLCFVAAIGGSDGTSRLAVHDYLEALGIAPVSLLHSTAWVDETATLGSGAQVLAMAAVGVDVSIGRQCIVNTNATVDHDTTLGDGVHVMPGATIAGQVMVGDRAVIGSNATVLPNIRVGPAAVIGAGAVVTRHVHAGATVVGVPAAQVGSHSELGERPSNPWLRGGTAMDEGQVRDGGIGV